MEHRDAHEVPGAQGRQHADQSPALLHGSTSSCQPVSHEMSDQPEDPKGRTHKADLRARCGAHAAAFAIVGAGVPRATPAAKLQRADKRIGLSAHEQAQLLEYQPRLFLPRERR